MTRLLISVAAAGLCLAAPGAAQETVAVSFAKGTSSKVLSGSLKGDQDRSYTLDARAGQTMTVKLQATRGSAEMNVWGPGGDTALSIGAPDPYNLRLALPATGRYRIQVYQMRAAARRGETANYTLTVGVTGGAAHAAGDARVAGTKYHATADVSCIVTPGGRPGACKAGVIRSGNGNAVVELQTPDGGQRSITFTGGRATGSNASAPLNASRSGDVTTVRIGPTEVYYIPDALVVGG